MCLVIDLSGSDTNRTISSDGSLPNVVRNRVCLQSVHDMFRPLCLPHAGCFDVGFVKDRFHVADGEQVHGRAEEYKVLAIVIVIEQSVQ